MLNAIYNENSFGPFGISASSSKIAVGIAKLVDALSFESCLGGFVVVVPMIDRHTMDRIGHGS